MFYAFATEILVYKYGKISIEFFNNISKETVMEKLNQIQKIVVENEKQYEDKLLLGLMDITKKQLEILETKAKEILNKYMKTKHMSEDESFWLSIYAICFDMYMYDGERFWESLARHLSINDKELRMTIVEAMKINYSTRNWTFYRTTRNEYVETVRMHGIIGNDNSGDKIIYALYYIYLKDFEQELSKEKFDLFFPYLKSLFERYGSFEEEKIHGKKDTVAYIRGQIPKSFIHAYLLNTPAVSDIIKQIFETFHSMHQNLELPKSLSKRFRRKIKRSFEENNNFENEYTAPYIKRNTSEVIEKDTIRYYKYSVDLNAPSHFLDFKPNEKRSAELEIYEDQKLLMKHPLVVFDGAIGWKNQSFSTHIKGNYNRIRYVICKTQNGETIYDSKEKFYKTPALYFIQPNGERKSADLSKLISGHVYEFEKDSSLSIRNASIMKTERSTFFWMKNYTEILFDDKQYEASKKEDIIYINKKYRIPNMQVLEDSKHWDIYQETLSMGILMRYPYSLNEVELIINEKQYKGLEIRKELLKKIKVKDDSDLLYILDLSKSLNADYLNKIEVYIHLKNIKLRITKFAIFYVKEQPVQYDAYNFYGKVYIHFNNSVLEATEKKEDKVILNYPNKPYQQLIIHTHFDKSKLLDLSISDFKEKPLFDTESGIKLTREEKEKVTAKLFDGWYLEMEEYLYDCILASGANRVVHEIIDNFDSFLEVMRESLPGVDQSYLHNFLLGVQQILTDKTEENLPLKKYILSFVEILNVEGLNKKIRNNINIAFRKYRPDYKDETQSVRYAFMEPYKGEEISSMSLVKRLPSNTRKLSHELYQIASRLNLNERKTIKLIKEVHETNPDLSEMGYYELVLAFRDLLNENTLSLSMVNITLFMNMFYNLAGEYNFYTVCDYMNHLEEWIDQNPNTDGAQYVRTQLLKLAATLKFDVVFAEQLEKQTVKNSILQ